MIKPLQVALALMAVGAGAPQFAHDASGAPPAPSADGQKLTPPEDKEAADKEKKKAYEKCIAEAGLDYPSCLEACPKDQTGIPAAACKRQCDTDVNAKKKKCKDDPRKKSESKSQDG